MSPFGMKLYYHRAISRWRLASLSRPSAAMLRLFSAAAAGALMLPVLGAGKAKAETFDKFDLSVSEGVCIFAGPTGALAPLSVAYRIKNTGSRRLGVGIVSTNPIFFANDFYTILDSGQEKVITISARDRSIGVGHYEGTIKFVSLGGLATKRCMMTVVTDDPIGP